VPPSCLSGKLPLCIRLGKTSCIPCLKTESRPSHSLRKRDGRPTRWIGTSPRCYYLKDVLCAALKAKRWRQVHASASLSRSTSIAGTRTMPLRSTILHSGVRVKRAPHSHFRRCSFVLRACRGHLLVLKMTLAYLWLAAEADTLEEKRRCPARHTKTSSCTRRCSLVSGAPRGVRYKGASVLRRNRTEAVAVNP